MKKEKDLTEPAKKIRDRTTDKSVDIINALKRYNLLKKVVEYKPQSLSTKAGKKVFEDYYDANCD